MLHSRSILFESNIRIAYYKSIDFNSEDGFLNERSSSHFRDCLDHGCWKEIMNEEGQFENLIIDFLSFLSFFLLGTQSYFGVGGSEN